MCGSALVLSGALPLCVIVDRVVSQRGFGLRWSWQRLHATCWVCCELAGPRELRWLRGLLHPTLEA